jgi:hypothetical protein
MQKHEFPGSSRLFRLVGQKTPKNSFTAVGSQPRMSQPAINPSRLWKFHYGTMYRSLYLSKTGRESTQVLARQLGRNRSISGFRLHESPTTSQNKLQSWPATHMRMETFFKYCIYSQRRSVLNSRLLPPITPFTS